MKSKIFTEISNSVPWHIRLLVKLYMKELITNKKEEHIMSFTFAELALSRSNKGVENQRGINRVKKVILAAADEGRFEVDMLVIGNGKDSIDQNFESWLKKEGFEYTVRFMNTARCDFEITISWGHLAKKQETNTPQGE